MRKQKLELLMVGPDNIGIQEIIAKVGIQQEGDSDSDDAFEEKWMVPVRGSGAVLLSHTARPY